MKSSNTWGMRRIATCSIALLAAASTVALIDSGPAGAVQTPHVSVVSANPADYTPHVLNGQVNAIAQVGDTIFLGGSFSQVATAAAPGTPIARSNFLAFNATNGTILPLAPNFAGEVTAIVPAADGQSLYVGGFFTGVNGNGIRSLARISTATGATVPGFTVPALTGSVRDLRLVGNRLFIAGAFTHVAGVSQLGLASLNATTGARDPYMNAVFAGMQNGGTTQVLKIDVTPDGSRLFAIGNFATVNGQPNRQVVAFDLGATLALSSWRTTFFTTTCSSSFNTYMRDLDISPDGSYVVITTTGAYAGGPNGACDTNSRFEVNAVAADANGVRPTWVNYTGGDTSYAVAVTGEAVYVGGHFRWSNNAWAADRAGRGAVSREGLTALDPRSGMPLSWNPGRTTGVGVFDLLATSSGLWMASDTDRTGNFEYHGRIAFFPLQGGIDLPPDAPGRLPGRAYLLDPQANNNGVSGRLFDGDVPGPTTNFPTGPINDNIRGAVMIDGTVYAGFNTTGANFVAYPYDGTTWGTADPVDTSDLITYDTEWHTDVRNLTGLFFDNGRLYYTVSGTNRLFYRGFSTESQVVGSQRICAVGSPVGIGRDDCKNAGIAGLDFSTVRSMFLGGGNLYWANADGELRRVAFSNGAVSGTPELVSSPALDGADWRARAVFLFTGAVSGVNQSPTASFTASCDADDCDFDGSGSTDPDGTIATYAWDFGDGATGSGATVSHEYAASGSYDVTLTVTDNGGATASTTQSVTYDPTVGSIAFAGAATGVANATTHRVTIPAGVTTGDGLLLFVSNNNPSATLSAPTGGGTWTLVDTVNTGSLVTQLYRASAGAGAAGSTIQLTTSATSKVNVTVVAYHGTAANPVEAFARLAEPTSTTSHATPTVNVGGAGRWVVSYWAHKDSSGTAIAAPGDVTARSGGAGTASGRVISLAGDSGGQVAAGQYGGKVGTVTGGTATRNATMWTVVLAPGAGAPPNQPPTASFTPACTGLSCTFTGSGTDTDGTITGYAWDFGDGSTDTTSGATASHTYAAGGTYTVQLTVTDDDSAVSAAASQPITVAPPGTTSIAFIGAATSAANATTHRVTIPAGAAPGDGLLLFASSNTPAATMSAPTGGGTWTLVDTVDTGSVVTRLWQASGGTGVGGATVELTTSALAKVNLTVLAYDGTAATPIETFARAAETATMNGHTTPTVSVGGSGRWVVSYWAHKDSGSDPALTPPADVTSRSTGASTGSGRVLSLAADSGAAVSAGTYGGKVATAVTASRQATMWTIVLAPA